MINGVDCSNVNGHLDLAAIAREHNLSFLFFKATEGRGFKDPLFPDAWKAIRALGLVRGAYHFAHPMTDAKAQAEAFLGYVRSAGLEDTDLLALDLEVTDERPVPAVSAWAQEWCSVVHAESGRKPIVYTFLSFAWQGNCAGLGEYPLWIADPSSTPGRPRIPAPWTGWALHQYGQQGLDLDVANYPDAHAMAAALAVPGSKPQPSPSPVPSWQEAMLQALPTLTVGSDDKNLPHWLVRRVQIVANEIFGVSPRLTVDGVFGSKTAAGVQQVQRQAGIADDGKVGADTWPVIWGAS